MKQLGYSIYAISPDTPDKVGELQSKNDYDYTLLSDASMQAAMELGVAFRLDDKTVERYKAFGINLVSPPGQEGMVLPVPAVFVVDRAGKVAFRHYDANYTRRLEPDKLLAAARAAANPRGGDGEGSGD